MHAASAELKLLSMKKTAKYKDGELDGPSKIHNILTGGRQQQQMSSFHNSRWILTHTSFTFPLPGYLCLCLQQRVQQCSGENRDDLKPGKTYITVYGPLLLNLHVQPPAVNALPCKLVPGLDIMLLERSLSSSKL